MLSLKTATDFALLLAYKLPKVITVLSLTVTVHLLTLNYMREWVTTCFQHDESGKQRKLLRILHVSHRETQ